MNDPEDHLANLAAKPTATLAAALQRIRQRYGGQPPRPDVGLILGSGLGGLVDEIQSALRIDYRDLPGFATATAAGHRGQLVLGQLDGHPVVALAGRTHRYEGHHDAVLTYPLRVMVALGISTLVVSNAAGGLNPLLQIGDVVVIVDHIDLGKRRANGPFDLHQLRESSRLVAPASGRFAVHRPYDEGLVGVALAAARGGDFPAVPGIYVSVLGPTYETRAEYQMLRRLGGDVVGMSTAPEVALAARLGVRVLGMSVVSNVAHSDLGRPTDHQEVIAAGRAAGTKLRRIVEAVLSVGDRHCPVRPQHRR